MSTNAPPPAESRVYHIVLFGFAGARRAGDVLQEIDAAQKLADVKIVAEAWVERDPRGNVHVHEAGRGGAGATAGAIAGGALGLLGGPLAVPLLALAGGVFGGVAGHLAGRAIPKQDLVRLGNALPLNSSGLVVLAEEAEAERAIDRLKGYQADVVTVVVGDELSGEIDAALLAEVNRPLGTEPAPAAPPRSSAPAAAAPPAAGQPETGAPSAGSGGGQAG
jgi:uncharacterized membrane protein